MKLSRRLDPRIIFTGLYVLALAAYIVVGLHPADATDYTVSTQLVAPAIGLSTDVTELTLNGHHLDTPDTIVGSYSESEHKTLLIGHSTTVFTNLNQLHLGDIITYAGETYHISAIDKIPKPHVNMRQLLAPADQDTLVIMTCAGQLLGGGDATHRLILTAVKD